MTPSDAALRAWAYLSRVAEPPNCDLIDLIDEVGPEAAAEMVRRRNFPPGFEALAEATAARAEVDTAGRDLEHIAALGGRLVTPDHSEWPAYRLQPLARRDRDPNGSHDDDWRELRPIALWSVGTRRLDELLDRSYWDTPVSEVAE